MKAAMSPGMKDLARGLLMIVLLALPLVFTRFIILLLGPTALFVTTAYYICVVLYSVITLIKMRSQKIDPAKKP